jgi:AcrR family transcriptional regulator
MARTRSKEAHTKVLDAAIALFADRGIDATSMDAIAEQSGVSKATIYKHWPSKDTLALEALSYLFGADAKVPVPDTGNLRADLIVRLSHQPAPERKQQRDRVMPHVIAYASSNKDFGTAWRNRAMKPLIDTLTEWIQREQKRATLCTDIHMEVATALLVGPLMYRNIFHRTTGKTNFAPGLEAAIAESFLLQYAVQMHSSS